MYVVTGVTGRTGAVVANTLIQAGLPVRVVVRDIAKAHSWTARGAQVAVADLADTESLTQAFRDAQAVYIVKPPNYTRETMFEQADVTGRAVAQALRASGAARAVLLSSVGADRPSGTGVIATNHAAEQHLADAGIPVTFVRAAYFMENWSRVAEIVRSQGILPSLLVPTDRAISMVSAQDIGNVCAHLLQQTWDGVRAVGLEGPRAYSPDEIADGFAEALKRPVRAQALPESQWVEVLAQNPFSKAAIRGFVALNQGLNSGHIAFDSDPEAAHIRGNVAFETVARDILGV